MKIKLIICLLLLILLPNLSSAACTGVPDNYTMYCPGKGILKFTDFSFTPACEQHDKCYDDCEYTHNNHKQYCENTFYNNLKSQCPKGCAVYTCDLSAKLYQTGVTIGGYLNYINAQEACVDKWLDNFSLETIDWEKIAKKLGISLSEELLNSLKSVDWSKHKQQVLLGIKTELKAAINTVYKQQVVPLLKDMEVLLKNRQLQFNNMTEQRSEQFTQILEDKLQKIDNLVQSAFKQYKDVLKATVQQIEIDIIDYAGKKYDEFSVETKQKIKVNIVEYSANSFKQITDNVVAKFNADVIDTAVVKLEKLQNKLQQDSNEFFRNTKELAYLMNCTKKKAFADWKHIISKFSNNLNQDVLGSCYQELGLQTMPESFEYSTWYDLNTCYSLKILTRNTKVSKIARVYAELKKQAEFMICQSGNDISSDYYWWDWVEFDYYYQFWSKY